ncbi:glycoside hydrolase family 73 protein [Paenibacillus sp. FSL M8-0142]|uniref:glycoside hydrolase family 73 protein n=1 Tax=Paenibacillus sp. FSL M8-0142 TaxID=2954525 RepID=UPI00315A5E0D
MSSKQAFIQKIAIFAAADMKNTFIPASLIIAQAALESAWGTSGLTKKGNNLFGIKGRGPAGSCTMPTTEYVNGKPIKVDAAFRAYNNWGESIADHTKLILNGVSWDRNKYKKVIGVDGKTAAREIQEAGYATDPKYADKLIAIMDEYNLYQYDIVKGGSEPVKETKERDINVVSPWAAAAWEEMKKNGYVDGSRPGAAITREETAVIFNRMRKNFLQLIAGNSEHLADLEKRLQKIETEK